MGESIAGGRWVPGDDAVLFEREADVSDLESIVRSAVDGRGSVTVLEGPAGVGKTALIRRMRAFSGTLGVRVMSAWCGEMEKESPFGVVKQLFSVPLAGASSEEQANLMDGAAQLARPVLFGSFDCPGTMLSDPIHSTLHGLYWLVSNLAEKSPLLLVVDDAHWADTPSLRFLAYLSRRLDELPVALLLAARIPVQATGDHLLNGIVAEESVRVIRPAGLSVNAVRSMVTQRLGETADHSFAETCHRATGGNPFLMRELVYELAALGIVPTNANSGRVPDLVPVSIGRAVQARIRQLPPEALKVASAVAILGENADLRRSAELADLEAMVATRAVDALVGAGILHAGRPLRFVHPIVAASMGAEMSGTDRCAGHRRAADLLVRDGAPLDQIATHLMFTDPVGDPKAIAVLRKAARQGLTGGAPEAAASWLRRALEESRSKEARAEILTELCIAEARKPAVDSFDFLRRGLETTAEPRQRAAIALELAHVIGMVADMDAALLVLANATADLADADPALALEIEAEYITVARLRRSTRPSALARLDALRDHADPSTATGSVLLANLAMAAVERCDPASQAADLARQALRGGFLVTGDRWVLAYAANTLMWSDRIPEAKDAWDGALREARRRGSVTMFMLASTWRSHLAYRQGDLPGAEAEALLALEAARRHGWEHSLPYPLAFFVDALVARGALDAAGQLLTDVVCPTDLHYLLAARGRLRCAQQRWREGLEDLQECGRRLEPGGGGSNPAVIGWRSLAAAALERLGRTSDARSLAEEELHLARSFGAPGALGVAQRTIALLSNGGERIDGLEQAAGLLKGCGARLEYARAMMARASALRAANRRDEAVEDLREALEAADECGAHGLRSEAQEAMMAMGLRPRRFARSGIAALTPTERRVAEMAAKGLTNREIGQSLFVSLKTVEAHLASAFRKLAISTRSDLFRALHGSDDTKPLAIGR